LLPKVKTKKQNPLLNKIFKKSKPCLILIKSFWSPQL
jgi:hypothetical protein